MDSDREPPDRRPAPRGRAPRHGARRDLPELPDLQRRRVRRPQGPRRGRRPADPPRARRADHRRRRGRSSAARTAGSPSYQRIPSTRPEVLRHDAHNPDPSQQFALSRLDDPTPGARADRRLPRGRARPTYDDLVRAPDRRGAAAGRRAGHRRGPRRAARRARHLDRGGVSRGRLRSPRDRTEARAAARSYGALALPASGARSRSTSARWSRPAPSRSSLHRVVWSLRGLPGRPRRSPATCGPSARSCGRPGCWLC